MRINKPTMLFFTLCASLSSGPVLADTKMNGNPIITKLSVQSLEYGFGSGANTLNWEQAQLQIGTDLNGLSIRSNGHTENGKVDEANLIVQYSRGISAFWDLQAGWKRDIRPQPHRDSAVFGLSGTAPYRFEVESYVGIGRGGNIEFYLDAEKELLITNRWMLAPQFSINAFSQKDPEVGIGSGVNETELALRLHYVWRKNLLPYIGIAYQQEYGETADLTRAEGDSTHNTQWVVGIQGWL